MQRVIKRLLASVRAVISVWEAFQVEMQGQYSLALLDELSAFAQQTGLLRALAITLFTPLSCVTTIVVIDVFPLRPPTGGIRNQSATYWVRMFFSVAVVTSTVLLHFQHASPRLQLTRTQLIVVTTSVCTATTAVILLLHLLIGFPTPFVFQAIGLPWQALLVGSMWTMWKSSIREDTSVGKDLLQYVWAFSSQFAMLLTYPVLILVFRTLDGFRQTLFSFGLPFFKLFLRNWASRGVYRVEDLAPVYVVLSVDVFHALMLSCAMQSASSQGTLVSVMTVDFLQSVVAVMEVGAIAQHLRKLREEMLSSDHSSASLPWRTQDPRNVMSLADAILTSHPHVRHDRELAVPRHVRLVRQQLSPRRVMHETDSKVVPVTGPISSSVRQGHGVELRYLTMAKRAPEIEYVRRTLTLLHMVEFYVLIEFTEVVLAVIYAIYLLAMFHLPNRVYYSTLKELTRDQLLETIGNVIEFAALEMLSFVVLAVALDHLVGYSTLRQLAFTLRKHALLAQSMLVLWVFFPTQLTLEHLGNDYTFRFEWLRHPDAHA